MAFTSAPRAMRDRARRRSLSQAASISCWFSLACSFWPGLGAGCSVVDWGVGGLVEAGGRVACGDGSEVAGSSAVQAAMATTTAVRTPTERMGFMEYISPTG
jgi:hypothetical protein